MEHSENHEDDPEGDSGYRHFLSRMSDLLTQAIRNEFCTFPDHVCTSMDFIIYNKMKENNILVRKNDPNYLRYFHVRAIGTFECDDCGENWTCYNVSIIVDFYKPKVSQIYKHYYRCCYECWGDINFKNKQFERIADRAIMYYKKRKEAGGIIPAIENNGSYSSKAFKAHEESECERCRELDEPCWLHLVPCIKKVPYEMAHLVNFSLGDINEPLNKLHASVTMEVKDASKTCRIHINPLSGSENIKQWRQQCETILESYLQNFSSMSMSVQPELFSKQMMIIPKPSLFAEFQTLIHVTGSKIKVAEAFKRIETTAKELKRQHEAEKCKPCIILW